MITTAPLPSLAALAAALAGGQPARPGAAWCRPGDRAVLVSRSAWALALLARLRGGRVVLPAWFCGASLLPLRAMGASLRFLPVDRDGHADWSRAGEVDLLLAVHPFGQVFDLGPARAAADAAGALLVEDCAHVLAPAPGLGESGDVVLYSPHKLLALPEGAVTVVRPAAAGLQPELERLVAMLPPAPSPRRWLWRRLIQSLLPDALRPVLPQGGQPDLASDPPAGEAGAATGLSALALALLGRADLATEAASRRRHAASLRQSLSGLPGWEPLFASDGPAPYRLALRCASEAVAAERYARLCAARLPVETWPDLPPEVTADHAAFGAAWELRRTVLLLPVHGALPDGMAELYGRALA